MQLYLGQFGPVRIVGRTLVILCSYLGGTYRPSASQSSSRLIRLTKRFVGVLTLRPLRTYINSMRNHYANPRSLPLQVQMAEAALATGKAATVRVIVDSPLAGRDLSEIWPGKDIEIVPLSRTLPELRDVDTVLLVYPDAIGLGWRRFESWLLAAGAQNIVCVTGRRRMFPLVPSARCALRWRRALAATRCAELIASLALIPFAAILSGYDRLRGRA